MLKLRVITASALLFALALAVVFASQSIWVLIMLFITTLCAWEWGGLLAFDRNQSILLALLHILLSGVFLSFFPAAVGFGSWSPSQASTWAEICFFMALILWGAIIPLIIYKKWQMNSFFGVVLSFMVLFPAWIASCQSKMFGPLAMLFFIAILWISDSSAYFSGKRFGKRKLAPAISPGKTWEGVWGALIAVLIYASVIVIFTSGVGTMPSFLLIFFMLMAAIFGIEGDLFESYLKRSVGIKDSSNLLPGHGGLLDRLDALLPVLPLSSYLIFIYAA